MNPRFLFYPLVLCLWTVQAPAWACSCAPQPENLEMAVKQALENAVAVVLAKAESVETANEYIETTQFVAKKSWKGTHGKRFYTRINVQCCVCGMSFEKNKVYLLYLYGPSDEGYFGTGICTRTQSLETAQQDIAILDQMVDDDTSGKNGQD